MPISIKPTKIKQSYYLLIPKNIADLINIQDSSKLNLEIKKHKKGLIIEYSLTTSY
jgi:hypothetical protein